MATQPAEERTTSAALSLHPAPVTERRRGSRRGNLDNLSESPNGSCGNREHSLDTRTHCHTFKSGVPRFFSHTASALLTFVT